MSEYSVLWRAWAVPSITLASHRPRPRRLDTRERERERGVLSVSPVSPVSPIRGQRSVSVQVGTLRCQKTSSEPHGRRDEQHRLPHQHQAAVWLCVHWSQGSKVNYINWLCKWRVVIWKVSFDPWWRVHFSKIQGWDLVMVMGGRPSWLNLLAHVFTANCLIAKILQWLLCK